MLDITTNKQNMSKKVLLDGHTYVVRQLGAGETLTFMQLGREMTKLENKENPTKADEKRYEDMRVKSMKITLDLFDPLGDEKAETYINSLSIETLLKTLPQIFDGAKADEPTEDHEDPTTNA